MKVREKGYEYKGWKLGQRVKVDGRETTIVGFNESSEGMLIGVYGNDLCVKDSLCMTSYMKGCEGVMIDWVYEGDIEKVKKDLIMRPNTVVRLTVSGYEIIVRGYGEMWVDL